MTPFAELLQQGAGNAWLFVPSAVLPSAVVRTSAEAQLGVIGAGG